MIECGSDCLLNISSNPCFTNSCVESSPTNIPPVSPTTHPNKIINGSLVVNSSDLILTEDENFIIIGNLSIKQ